MDLRKYKAPALEIEFEEVGKVYIKKMTSAEADKIDAIADLEERIYTALSLCLVDEKGKNCGYSIEDCKEMPSDLTQGLYIELVNYHSPKKKVDSKEKN
tara:strand:- start:286 stop:582 length:297 start_codon:yes stop_codon:yes gene_type:complete